MFNLKAMPATPMTQEEMEGQCRIVSEVAKLNYAELDEIRDSIVSEAVGKAVALGRPFDDHWYYRMPIDDRKYFTSIHEFVMLCDILYSKLLEGL